MLSTYVYSLFIAVAVNALASGGLYCKPQPGSPGWPSPSVWHSLNASIAGRLSAAAPPGAVCHSGQAAFSTASCAALQAEWINSSYHASNPWTTDYNDDACLPDRTAPCSNASYPAYAIEATSAADVQAGVRFARDTGVRLVVKGTGHDWPGRSKGAGALEIWTHTIRGVEFDAKDELPTGFDQIGSLKIAAGMQWRDIYAFAAQRNLTVVGGADLDVGIGGWIMGGGHSPLSSVYGLGADQVLQMEVVTADGEHRFVDDKCHPDLFWALRGGGGSTYAVMLSVTVKVYQSIPGTICNLSYSTTAASDTFWSLAARFHSHLPNMSEAGGMGYYGLIPTNGGSDPEQGGTILAEFLFPKMNQLEVSKVMASFTRDLNGVGWAEDRIYSFSNAFQFPDFTSFWLQNPVESVGSDGRLGSWLLDGSALGTNLSTLSSQLRKSTPTPNILIGHLVAGPGVRNAHVPHGDAVLPAWRSAYAHTVLARTWAPFQSFQKAAIAEELRSSAVPALKVLTPHSGAYLNEADPTNPDWQNDYYGDKYERLLQIKEKWDPAGVFWCKPCVGHELWDIVDGPATENKLEWGVGQSAGKICRKPV